MAAAASRADQGIEIVALPWRPRVQHAAAGEGPADCHGGSPDERLCHFADDDDGRRRPVVAFEVGNAAGQRADGDPLVWPGTAADDRDRRLRRLASCQQAARPPLDLFHAHVDRQGSRKLGELPKVDHFPLVGGFMARQDREARRRRAACQRDARSRGCRHGRSDAGHDLEENAGVPHRSHLFSQPAEHRRIAPLQPHDGAGFRCQPHEQPPDRFAGVAVAVSPIPRHRQTRHARGYQVEYPLRHERIVDHDVGGAEAVHRTDGEQLRIAGPSAHEQHPALVTMVRGWGGWTVAGHRKSGGVDEAVAGCLGHCC